MPALRQYAGFVPDQLTMATLAPAPQDGAGLGVAWASAVAVLPQASSIACAPTARPTGPATLQCLRMTIRRCACPAARPGCCRIVRARQPGALATGGVCQAAVVHTLARLGLEPVPGRAGRCLSSWPTGRVAPQVLTGPPGRHHHPECGRGRRRRARPPPHRARRALPHPHRPSAA